MVEWRNDLLDDPHKDVTIMCVSVCARDPISTGSDYKLVITHVMTFYGKAFMPTVRCATTDRLRVNGGTHRCDNNPQAYRGALDEGNRLLAERIAELNKLYQSYVNRGG